MQADAAKGDVDYKKHATAVATDLKVGCWSSSISDGAPSSTPIRYSSALWPILGRTHCLRRPDGLLDHEFLARRLYFRGLKISFLKSCRSFCKLAQSCCSRNLLTLLHIPRLASLVKQRRVCRLDLAEVPLAARMCQSWQTLILQSRQIDLIDAFLVTCYCCRSGLVWSGLVWSGLVWSGLVWSGLVWSGLVWSGLV